MKMLKIIGALVLMMALMAGFAAAENPKVLIKTSKGDITVELYQGKAPITVENFLTFVDEKLYDGTSFLRIKINFMIQGGAYTPDLEQKQARLRVGSWLRKEQTILNHWLRKSVLQGRVVMAVNPLR